MDAAALIENPDLIYDVPDYQLEQRAREVVELLVKRGTKKGGETRRGKKATKVAEDTMRFIAAVYRRSQELPNAIVMAYSTLGGNVDALISEARRLKTDPEVGPYLNYLKTAINTYQATSERCREGRLVVYRATEKGCMWAGMNAKQTKAHTHGIVSE